MCQPVLLGGKIPLAAGTYVGYNAYGTNRDQEFWGPGADDFRPERWGQTNDEIQAIFWKANAKGAFISFYAGRRACLGQKFGMFTSRITIAEILRKLEWKIDPAWPGWPRQMTLASDAFEDMGKQAGPLYARNLRVQIRKIG
ncbi:cytochrome P450-dit2 [Emydomyces testavorans]|uniref:Cytochrome P450-dit2 n=1 Tax=Emydomyces testavorans TaxID=2070801 RepID=A0AAF0IK85_9EURO|nr:cytochrome P450-dit2 [Emydomyces testavorans]